MSQRQVDDKLLSQIAHLTGAEPNLVRLQLLDDFLGSALAQEKRLTDEDQHIVTKGAARGHQLAQGLGAIEGVVGAVLAVQEGFVRV